VLYQQGYFRQMIDKDGAQQALFHYNKERTRLATTVQSRFEFCSGASKRINHV